MSAAGTDTDPLAGYTALLLDRREWPATMVPTRRARVSAGGAGGQRMMVQPFPPSSTIPRALGAADPAADQPSPATSTRVIKAIADRRGR